MRYSVEPRDEIFIIIKGFNFIIKFLSFAKNMGKNIGKIISRNLNGKYSQNFLIMLNNLLLPMQLKLLQMELKLLQKISAKITRRNR